MEIWKGGWVFLMIMMDCSEKEFEKRSFQNTHTHTHKELQNEDVQKLIKEGDLKAAFLQKQGSVSLSYYWTEQYGKKIWDSFMSQGILKIDFNFIYFL